MTTLPLHLPESLRRKVETFALEEGVSVDEFIATALAEKLSTLTGDYLENRARRASRAKYEAALARVPGTEPLPPDRYPEQESPSRSPGVPAVESLGYDASVRKLEIRFRNGTTCQYYEVPEDVYRLLASSPSPARFIDEQVRTGPYPFRLGIARSA